MASILANMDMATIPRERSWRCRGREPHTARVCGAARTAGARPKLESSKLDTQKEGEEHTRSEEREGQRGDIYQISTRPQTDITVRHNRRHRQTPGQTAVKQTTDTVVKEQ